jgi:AcrR family transcriptional regulator
MPGKNKKYDTIIRAARELFWKHGFRRISTEEICRHAGVSKMTFYKYFPNKLELARVVFDKEAAKGAGMFREIMKAPIPPDERMKRILLMKMEGTNDISSEFLADFYNNPELGLKDHIEETTRKMWGEIVDDFRKAQENGVFRKDFKPELMWYLSMKMMEFINDENLMKFYSSPNEMIMELAGFFVYGIAPQGKTK